MIRNVGFLIMSLALIASVIGCSSKPASYTTTAITSSAATNTNASASIAISSTNALTNSPITSAATLAPTTVVTTFATTPSISSTMNLPTINIGFNGIFSPSNLTIAVGTTVSFENDDCCDLQKVSSDFPFDKNIDPSSAINFLFDKAGKYIFWIDNNQLVTGTIIVA